MPITPRFSLAQDADAVYLTVAVPHVRVSAAELDVDGRSLCFFCAPYLLRLTLPGELVGDDEDGGIGAGVGGGGGIGGGGIDGQGGGGADGAGPGRGRSAATYDPDLDGGTLRVRALKRTRGEHFADLDLVTRLLQPPARFPSRPAAEESGEGNGDGDGEGEDEDENEEGAESEKGRNGGADADADGEAGAANAGEWTRERVLAAAGAAAAASCALYEPPPSRATRCMSPLHRVFLSAAPARRGH